MATRPVYLIAMSVVLALALTAGPLSAQEPEPVPDARTAEEIEERAAAERAAAKAAEERARRLQAEMEDLRSQSLEAARKAQALEAELNEIEVTIRTLEAEEARKRAGLSERREQLADTLAALQRIALLPPEAMASSPESPLKVVRGASLLRIAVPAIEERAARLREELDSLDVLRADIQRERQQMRATVPELRAERERLDTLAQEKQRLRERAAAESRTRAERAETLAAEARDMRELIDRLQAEAEERAKARAEAARRAEEAKRIEEARRAEQARQAEESRQATTPPPRERPEEAMARETPEETRESQIARLTQPAEIREFPEGRDTLRMPVSGRLMTRYGEPLRRAGSVEDSRGLVLRARSGAQVVATFDGQVAYAGPFRGYGRILIIEHGGQYHTLLAGLDRIDAVVGQWVLAGEPVGVMEESGPGDPELYVELRRGGRPINPLPWLAETGDKVQG